MESSDLRIGNWVLINGKIIHMDLKMFHAVLMGFDGYVPEPIPLTKEWLLKFGFEKFKEYNIYSKGESFQIDRAADDNNAWWFFIGSDNHTDTPYCVVVKHVHQLQNLYFALTETELTIKN